MLILQKILKTHNLQNVVEQVEDKWQHYNEQNSKPAFIRKRTDILINEYYFLSDDVFKQAYLILKERS